MKSVRHFIIKAPETHNTKSGSIYLNTAFENQQKAKQIFKLVSSPKKYKDIKADQLIVHFNTVTFTLKDGEKIPSNNYIKDDYFYVNESMVHGFIDDGIVKMFADWNLVMPIQIEEVVTKSGIVVDLSKKVDSKKSMNGVLFSKNEELEGVDEGDKVLLTEFCDYEIYVNGTVYWCVKNDDIIGKYED